MDLDLLPHKDKDAGVLVALYINEMIKIVVPNAPCNNDGLKETFWFAMFVMLCKTSFDIVSLGQSELTATNAPVGRSVHWMGCVFSFGAGWGSSQSISFCC